MDLFCGKCGSDDVHTSWHKDGYACSHDQRQVEEYGPDDVTEHLHRTCRNCQFAWHDLVLGGEPQIVIDFNRFIEMWCGDDYFYLIDSDENAGERFRDKLRVLARKS